MAPGKLSHSEGGDEPLAEHIDSGEVNGFAEEEEEEGTW